MEYKEHWPSGAFVSIENRRKKSLKERFRNSLSRLKQKIFTLGKWKLVKISIFSQRKNKMNLISNIVYGDY